MIFLGAPPNNTADRFSAISSLATRLMVGKLMVGVGQGWPFLGFPFGNRGADASGFSTSDTTMEFKSTSLGQQGG